jgi:hypothetical protein
MYLKISGSNITYPYSIQDLKLENKNISFPSIISDSLLETFGVYKVELKDSGYENDYTKDVIELAPIISGSVYVQTFNVVDADETTINTRMEVKWEEIRQQRNQLLSESDWTQFQDSPITGSQLTLWQTYRQELRNITSQSNPFEIIWPIKP